MRVSARTNASVIKTASNSSLTGFSNVSKLQEKSVFGHTSTIAQRIDPKIINNPIIAGKIRPGSTKSSKITKDTPSKNTSTSSCPARPDTYLEPKKISTNIIPAIPKKPKPGVLNSINSPSNPIPIIIGPTELSHNPALSAQLISILINS